MSGKEGLGRRAAGLVSSVITDITGFASVAGQALMAASFPVVIASDQSAIDVTPPEIDATTPYTLTCVVADTEYSQALPANTRYFEFQCRGNSVIRWAFVTGKVAGPADPYRTLKVGDSYFSPAGMNLTGVTLYVASPDAGAIVELLTWQ